MSEPIENCVSQVDEYYDLKLHIGSIFIIMGCSCFGTLLPIVGKRITQAKGDLLFYCGKLFGTGVIMATALVHMLTPASANLTNECLPQVFHDYEAFAGAICLFGMLSLHLLQFLVNRQIRLSHKLKTVNREVDLPTIKGVEEQSEPKLEHKHDSEHKHDHVHEHADVHALITLKERHVSTYILELGVASHSIIIGITLGVTRGGDFKSLLIALTFHQFFEGMALSSVVLDAGFKKKISALLMVIFYSLTTPLGVAIGIGIHRGFQENSINNLITQGVLDALSAGILLYDSLVNIIVPHFSNPSYMESSLGRQLTQLGSLWLGATLMALVGRWA